jgi:competence ComEA-like helix-hairpin-helix protein
MADSININKASLEELIQIKNIGSKRAAIIIKTREEKGNLTLEDLKLLEGIPNTIWDPLIQNGDITMDAQDQFDTEQHSEKQAESLQGQIYKMSGILKQRTQENKMFQQQIKKCSNIMIKVLQSKKRDSGNRYVRFKSLAKMKLT